MGFLTQVARDSIDEFRALGPSAEGAASEDLQEAVAVEVVDAMRGFFEFSSLMAIGRQLDVSKNRQEVITKHMDLLGDLNRRFVGGIVAGESSTSSEV
jgi:hypothetical protein